jgi:hypothetical protein
MARWISRSPLAPKPILPYLWVVKTTLDIPDDLFRAAKATAALRGTTLRQLVTDTLRHSLKSDSGKRRGAEPPWMKDFGALSRLSAETRRIQTLIDEEFEQIEP